MESQRRRHGMTRRAALRRGVLGAAALALMNGERPVAAAAPANARAKSVIQIWMWGGPSHLDTFDPKPDAGNDYCGPMGQAIATNVDGIQINAALPQLAQQADKYAIIRSMTHGVNAHETASYIVQTGRRPDRLVYPCVGAVVALFKGYDHGYAGIVPPYVVLTEPQGRFSEAGLLGQRYKPFATGDQPGPVRGGSIVAEGIRMTVSWRADLAHFRLLGRAMPETSRSRGDPAENAWLMFGEARRLFDLNAEGGEMRDRYGRNTFGQSCLMARRLVEAGVPYVTINYKGWDTHKQHFEIMKRKLPELDQGMATLLQDLSDRGLLDSTIVWWGGEFGRSPKVEWGAPWNGGRQHYGACFCSVVAGGGFKGGRVLGVSDARGEEVAERPVYPLDLIGTMYELLGIDPDGPLPNPRGLELRVLPAPGDGAPSGGRLRELI